MEEEKIIINQEIELPKLERQENIKDIMKEKMMEKLQDDTTNEEIEVETKGNRISKKVLRVEILGKIQCLYKKLYGEPMIGISKKPKKELQQILADLMKTAVSKIQTSTITEEQQEEEKVSLNIEEEKLEPVALPGEEVCVSALVRFGLIAMDLSEKLTKAYRPGGWFLHQWSKKFDSPLMMQELRACVLDIFRDNKEWLEPFLDCYSRLYLLLISSAMMSLRRSEILITREKNKYINIDEKQTKANIGMARPREESKAPHNVTFRLPQGREVDADKEPTD